MDSNLIIILNISLEGEPWNTILGANCVIEGHGFESWKHPLALKCGLGLSLDPHSNACALMWPFYAEYKHCKESTLAEATLFTPLELAIVMPFFLSQKYNV